jgi:4-amino-4-deoxy-L-arabinose transferase-like glycosyltransferase
LLTAAALLAFGFGAFLWWQTAHQPAIRYLPHHAPAHWIVYPKPPEATAHGIAEWAAVFRRSFVVGTVPSNAVLRVCGMTRCEIGLNGSPVELPAPASWKQLRQISIQDRLQPGENQLRVTVYNAAGPPALWLHLQGDGLGLVSDESWEVSDAGASWKYARRATAPMPRPKPGNALAGGEQTFRSLASRWPLMGLFALGAAIMLAGTRRWSGWAQGQQFASGLWGRFVASPTAVALAAAIALWVILFANNLGSLPRRIGFDVDHHLEYVQYLQERRTLPSAHEGMEMYNPPLYYGLGAAALGVSGLSVTDDAGIVVLRLFSLLVAGIHLALLLAGLRLVFPGETEKQLCGLLLAAFLPAHLYVSHYVTNETLTALFVTASLYVCLRILRQPCASPGWHAALGACLGAALLTKMSALLAVPWVFGALGARLLARRGTPRDWLRTVGVAALVCFVVSGWHYLRAWVRYGTPFVGAWDTRSGFAWWQDDGFRTIHYFLRFGESLARPCFSGQNGFADGVYSTLWGDALCGGGGGLEFRPPWNYDLMAAGGLLALVPSLAILVGVVVAVVRLVRQPSAEWLVLVGLAGSFGAALVYMTLRVPCYSQVKATYGLLALLPFCAFGALGFGALARRGRALRVLLLLLVGVWAANSYATHWIRSDSIPVHLAAGRDLAQAGRGAAAAEQFARALVLDPHHAAARKYLVWLLLQNGQTAEAHTLARKAVDEDAADPEGHVTLALTLSRSGQPQEALVHLRRALELAPEHLMAHRQLTSILLELGRFEESLQACREGLAVTPTDSELHRTLESAQQRTRPIATPPQR